MAQAEPSRGAGALTEDQERAVARRSGPLVLTASAGSGKTTVLVERFVRAVCDDGIPPGRILAITFTERAAGELAERLRARLLELGERDAARDVERALVSTFHGFCARLLRTHARLAGVAADLRVLDEGQAQRLRLASFEDALAALVREEGDAAVELLAAYEGRRLREMVMSVYDELRSRGEQEPRLALPAAAAAGEGTTDYVQAHAQDENGDTAHGDASLGDDGPNDAGTPAPALDAPQAACRLLDRLLGFFSARYEERKNARGVVDFDDLELRGRRLLLEHRRVRDSWRQRFELMMVDELQDVNRRQLDILEALERDNLFTVGDELQSIYGFRHADVRLFGARREALSERGAALVLTHNFRSRPQLLDAVNAVFAARLGEGFIPLVAGSSGPGNGGPGGGVEPQVAVGRQPPLAQAQLSLPGLEPLDAQLETEPGPADVSLAAAGPAAAVEAPWGQSPPLVELLLTDRAFDCEEALRARSGALAGAPLSRQAEARMLAQRIAELVAQGDVSPGDVAVLLRAGTGLAAYAQALNESGLPVQASVGGFWDRLEVGDPLAYLRVVANPLDEEALYGVLASPLVDASPDALALVARERRGAWDVICVLAGLYGPREGDGGEAQPTADSEPTAEVRAERGERDCEQGGEGAPALEHAARLRGDDRAALVEFALRLAEDRLTLPWRGIAAVLQDLLDATGYRRKLAAPGAGERPLANLRKLVRIVREFEREEGPDVRGLLDYVAHIERAPGGGEPDAAVDDAELDAVHVMTIHAAKGLEFPVVCVAELGARPTLRMPDLLVDGGRIGLRLAALGRPGTTRELEYAELCEERRAAQEAEEDRILYVAMTRARDRLLLSGMARFNSWPTAKAASPPIAWLAPALVDDLPAWLAVGMQPELGHAEGDDPARSPAEDHPLDGDRGAGEGNVIEGPGGPLRLWLNGPVTFGQVWREEAADTVAGTSAAAVVGGRGEVDATGQTRSTPTTPDALAALGTGESAPEPAQAIELPTNYSALATLEACGYRYYLENVLHLPEHPQTAARGDATGQPPDDDREEAGETTGVVQPEDVASSGGLTPLARGRLVHAVLESFDFANPAGVDGADIGRAARGLPGGVREDECEEIAALIGEAGTSELARRLGRLDLRREQPFGFVVELGDAEQLVTGVFDVLAWEPDGSALVVDYKSDRVTAGEDPQVLVDEDYAAQRLIYALAALRTGAPAVEVIHWFLARPREWVTRRYEAAQAGALEGELRRRVERARARGYAVSERPHRALCGGCPGRGGMCSWSFAETARARPAR